MGVVGSSGNAAGRPVIDRSTCTVCGECAAVCVGGVLVKCDREIRIDHAASFDCIACGQCMMVCPMGSVTVTGRKASPADLVDLPPPELRADFERLEALFLARRSVRRFRKDQVPRETIDKVISAAATAPMGVPPWEVGILVFHGQDKVRALATDTADAYAKLLGFIEGPAGRVYRKMMKKTAREALESFILPLGRALVDGRKRGMDFVLYDAPAALLFHSSPYSDGADAYIACTYAMLAAESIGLGTCMIGCLPPVLDRRKDLKARHGIPEGHAPRIVLLLGRPAGRFLKGIRRPFLSVKYR